LNHVVGDTRKRSKPVHGCDESFCGTHGFQLLQEVMIMDRVARITEIIAASPISFEEAIKAGFERANRTLRGITGLRVLEERVAVEDGKILEYRVRLEVIFVLET
jgi:flavin-binding protein dodecin